jgi:PAS domain S-box-containing protein
MVMLYANTSEDRMLYREELMRFSRDNPHFTVFFVTQHISRELINKATKDLHHPLWYLMGPRNMVVETGKILGGMGIPDEDFSYEESSPFLYRSARVIAQDHISKTGLLWTGLESLAVQVIITNPEGEIFYANPATEKATGYSLSEIVGQTPRLWGGLMDHNFYKDLWTTIKYNRGAFSGRVTNRRKDGNKYVANLHVSPFFLKDGELGGFMAIEENITELFQEKEGAMNLAAIIQSSTDAIARVDLDGIVMSWNPAAERMFHYTEKEIIGQPIFEKIGGAKKEEMQTNIEAVKTGKTMNDMRSTRQTKDGAVINVLVSNWPVYDANNTLVGSSVLYHDISREEVLRELESQFIIIAAHQLRTPLTGIQWVSERLLKTAKLDFHGRSYLKDINSETLRLINLVNTLLNAARIEGGVLSVTPIPTEAVSFVAGQLKGYKRLMSSKKQTLAFITRGKRIDMETDQNAFRDIVQSLVTNAIEYTPDKGKITVHLKKLGNNLVLTVSDTGIGIPVTAQDFIFAKFFRADNAKLFKADGTGLGLYIAREAAKMLGGTIVFTSRLGRGTVFTVTLPLMTKTVKAEKSLI